MAITRSWEARLAQRSGVEKKSLPAERRRERVWLAGASAMVLVGLALVSAAKTQGFGEAESSLRHGALLNLNAVSGAADVVPFLQVFRESGERERAAEQVFAYVARNGPLPNVGALARLRGDSGRLLPLSRLKPLFVVRTPREFLWKVAGWAALYFGAFWLVHLVWSWRRFGGDPAILPALHLLTGFGLMLALSLRDPLRDTMEVGRFAWGVAMGCLLLLLPVLRAFDHRKYSHLVYSPLLAALGLFLLLVRFGSGPTGSDSKVNLGPFQPVEAIKILLVLFMAGYFARKWEWLRELRQKWTRIELPRTAETLPVMCAVGCSLVMFFVLKDLGPALVTGALFLALFSVARGRAGLAILGIGLLVAGVATGYRLGKPTTVVDRISMWQSPWDNNVRGGDQLAQSFWAFSTGGPVGAGPGLGDPGMIPAGHTDLVLPAIGEEWGLCGVLAILLLFGLLFRRAMRIALSAGDEYGMFLTLGFAALIAIEMLLISGGVLGVIPLSGVVSPFLSYGNTAMLANFFVFAVILEVSARPSSELVAEPFRPYVRRFATVLAVAAVALTAKAAYLQAVADRKLLARDVTVFQDDGVKRPQHNPRLNSLAREVVRGSVYDRNGVVLATSRWDELERHRTEFDQMGVSIDQTCSRLDTRHYPFGAATAHLLGDLRTGENFHATNASLIEHDQNVQLQGFRGYDELAPLVRHRHQAGNGALQALLARDRNVHSTIDVRLQIKAAEILARHVNQNRGALVVMDAESGDVLALASAPEQKKGTKDAEELLDRARYGQYPPGSTFKLVTAIAALRLDPALAHRRFHCAPLGDGRVGTRILGWNRPIRDDVGDHAHGSPDMANAIQVSCNAYFAQLGVFDVGAQALIDTAKLLDVPAGDLAEVKKMLPFAAYGQGPVLITPFKMARVAATLASGGRMPQGRWVMDGSNSRNDAPRTILPREQADVIADAMRSVVTAGTARRAMTGLNVTVAGKTGTAQVGEGPPHSWFTGFAPYGKAEHRIAFAVVVEHGGYGSQAAAPIARELVEAARDLGIIAADVQGR